MNYWTNRLDELETIGETDLQKELIKLYTKAIKDIRAIMLSLYGEIKADPDKKVSIYQYEKYYKLSQEINKRLALLGKAEEQLFNEKLMEMYEEVQASLDTFAPDRIKQSFITPGRPEQIIKEVWCADGKNWSSRIWNNKEELKERIVDGLNKCWVQGAKRDEWVKELAQHFNTSISRADTLARTELAHVAKQSALDRYAAAGIEEYKIITAHDNRVCKEDAAMDGKVFNINEIVYGVNCPPFHPNCRCTIIPVIK